MGVKYKGENPELFQKLLGKGGYIPIRISPTKSTEQQQEQDSPKGSHEHADEAEPIKGLKYPPLTEWLDQEDEDEFEPTITCPFCGELENENAEINCPHFFGYTQDYDYLYWVDEFKILDEIQQDINELFDKLMDSKESIFKGIPYWEHLEDEDCHMLSLLEKHPYINVDRAYCTVPCNATVHSYYFIDTKKKEDFTATLLEVKKRLDKLKGQE